MAFILECCVPFTRAPLAPPPFPDYMEIDCLIVPHPSSSSSSRSCRACVVFFCEGIFALYLAIIFCNNALPCSPSYDFLFFLFSFSSLLWECNYMRLSKHERGEGLLHRRRPFQQTHSRCSSTILIFVSGYKKGRCNVNCV